MNHQYLESYHLLVILDAMKIGFRPLKVEVIPRNEWIRDKLPLIRNLDVSPLYIKVPRFTVAKRIFRECIASIVRINANKHNTLQWQTASCSSQS
jgi:hypothetical protein